MSTITEPAAARLANELARHFGGRSVTADQLAVEIVSGERAPDLLAAIEDAVAGAAAADETDEIDEALWGQAPSDVEVAEARRRARGAVDRALADVLGVALTRDEAARQLGISPQAVSKRLSAGALVALPRGRERRFPGWQFHEGGVLPGLSELIAAYPGGALALTTWATTPNSDLDGRSPAQALTRPGALPRVLEAARALTADAW